MEPSVQGRQAAALRRVRGWVTCVLCPVGFCFLIWLYLQLPVLPWAGPCGASILGHECSLAEMQYLAATTKA